MENVSITEAGHQFANLMERVQQGESIQILDGESPVGMLVPVPSEPRKLRRLGFLQGQGHVPENWKEIGREEIERMFYGEE